MICSISSSGLLIFCLALFTNAHQVNYDEATSFSYSGLPKDTIPLSTREYWMRRANQAVGEIESPCLHDPFGTAIVNHTDTSETPLGKLICLGVNHVYRSGNPTVHGEVAAMNNCSMLLTDPEGEYKLSGPDALKAYQDYSLYTNGEPCPMCATAIRWGAFKELIFGTSSPTLYARGWGYNESTKLPEEIRVLKEVLANETDPLFSWQFNESYPCPGGCERSKDKKTCDRLEPTSHLEL